MTMIKIAVCDEEKDERNKLSGIIKNYFFSVNRKLLIKEYDSGPKLLCSNIRFDIIFLDIEMPELNGIETAKILRKSDVNSKIIYVTNYNNYKSSAYQVHAFDYITKPVYEKIVYEALAEVLRYMEDKYTQPKLVFKTEQGMINLKTDDIYYFEYSVRKVDIVSCEGRYSSNSYTLRELYEKSSKYNFESPHKSYIVNMLHIKLIKGFDIFIENGHIIPLAQKKAVLFKSKFNDFLQSTFEII